MKNLSCESKMGIASKVGIMLSRHSQQLSASPPFTSPPLSPLTFTKALLGTTLNPVAYVNAKFMSNQQKRSQLHYYLQKYHFVSGGKAVPQLMVDHGLAVERVYTGSFMTSLDMEGLSISIMRADRSILQRLDAETKAPYWPVGVSGNRLPAKIPVPIPRSWLAKIVEEPKLFRMDISSNIRYGCTRDVKKEDIEWAAKQAYARDFISALPNGYETLVDDDLLSGGQKQRIAIARATLWDPKILILDEATSALDAESEHNVKGVLRSVRSDAASRRTVIVIAHRLSTIQAADRIVVMDRGQIVEWDSRLLFWHCKHDSG